MWLFGRAGTRAHRADWSRVRSRTDAGACSRVRSRTSAGVRSRVRRGYGLVAARENSLGICRWRILSVDASLICRRCGSHRLVKAFVVSYLTTRVTGPCAWRSYLTRVAGPWRSCLTTRVAGRCARRSCLTTRVAGVPRARCATTCAASGCATTCTASGCATTCLHRHRHHRRRHPVPSRACSYRPRAPRRELSRGISLCSSFGCFQTLGCVKNPMAGAAGRSSGGGRMAPTRRSRRRAGATSIHPLSKPRPIPRGRSVMGRKWAEGWADAAKRLAPFGWPGVSVKKEHSRIRTPRFRMPTARSPV